MRFEAAPQLAVPYAAELRLRPLEAADLESWCAYLSQPGAVEHTSWAVQSVDDLRPALAMYNADPPDSPIRFAIVDVAAGRLAGTIGFHTISSINRTAEIAYDLHPDYWGRGIATAACLACLDWGFSQRGYVRIQATVLDTNRASARVVEKCGFVREGLLRRYRMVRRQPRDFWIYSVLSESAA